MAGALLADQPTDAHRLVLTLRHRWSGFWVRVRAAEFIDDRFRVGEFFSRWWFILNHLQRVRTSVPRASGGCRGYVLYLSR